MKSYQMKKSVRNMTNMVSKELQMKVAAVVVVVLMIYSVCSLEVAVVVAPEDHVKVKV